MRNDFIAIFVTCASKKEAEKIAHALLSNKLAACGNILQGVSSKFWWRGKIDSAKEALLILKTKRGKFVLIEKMVKKLHSYEVPEIIAFPINMASRAYLDWIDKSVS